MTEERKGFTLVEVIVVLVILAILAAIMIPAMTGWIDKAKEKRLITACRTCVIAAQTLASEAYGLNGAKTPPEGDAVVALAGVDGVASDISIDAESIAVDTLTYSEGAESVTYTRLPVPQYDFGSGIAGKTASVWTWAQSYVPKKDEHGKDKTREWLTIDYNDEEPAPLTEAQKAAIFGDLQPDKNGPLYIYPMAVYDKNGELMNIQYVTPQDPSLTNGSNRYQAYAFIVDGKTYISTSRKSNGQVKVHVDGKAGTGTTNSFQNIMNNTNNRFPLDSTQDFVDIITEEYFAAVK